MATEEEEEEEKDLAFFMDKTCKRWSKPLSGSASRRIALWRGKVVFDQSASSSVLSKIGSAQNSWPMILSRRAVNAWKNSHRSNRIEVVRNRE